MISSRPARRRHAALALVLAAALTAAGCSSGTSGSAKGGGADRLKIGLLVALTGPYAAIGTDMRDGFQQYLDGHGGRLGNHPIDVVSEDEGAGGAVAVPFATKLVKEDKVTAIVGLVANNTVVAVQPIATAAKVPILGTGGRPDLKDFSYYWTDSFFSTDPGGAIASYIQQNTKGPVFAIGPDYQGGYDELRGFTQAFAKAGGQLANEGGKPLFTPWPSTTDFSPYLTKIKASGAKAVYCFYAGANAVDFVKQYAQSDAKNIPLYAAGFLTEGGALKAEGPAAAGIISSMNYSPDIDNATNREFVNTWQAKHGGAQPTANAMYGYDAASILDQAIAKAGANPTPEQVNTAIGTLGQIDSPRGAWSIAATTHGPVQKWYLRRAQTDGTSLSNIVVQDLGTLGG
jgi:branched-chain amino acid transport system substrate-binding protein